MAPKNLQAAGQQSREMTEEELMVRAARGVRRRWFKLTTLSAERGEEFRPVDLTPLVNKLLSAQRNSLAVLMSCHGQARPIPAAA